MIFLGYNFLNDAYSMQPTPTSLDNISNVNVANAIFDNVTITKNTTSSYTTDIPVEWTLETQLNATFNDTINAGNINYVISEISSIKVKRRVKGTFDWMTLFNVSVNSIYDVDFVKYDYTNQNDVEYEYAIVPIIGTIEGEYSISEITSSFYGIFITDNNSYYKFLENTKYSNNERVRMSGLYQPYGSKYPISVHNGLVDYEKGNLSGDVILLENNELDRTGTINRLNNIKNFLKNNNAKILKDFNGNIWMIQIDGNIGVNYYSEFGMGFANINFNWVEIGDVNNSKDLYKNGIIEYYE